MRELVQRIEQRMAAMRTNAKHVSLRAGLGPTYVRDILKGKNKSPSLAALRAISGVLDLTLVEMLGEKVNKSESRHRIGAIPVVGVAEAGAFREMLVAPNDDVDDQPTINAPRSLSYPDAKHFAFLVAGNSMNAARPTPILDGTHVLCVDMISAELIPETGKVYVVKRTLNAGQSWEFTVKRAHVFKNRLELRPESTDPRHQTFVIKNDEADVAVQIEAIGLVYGTFNSFE